MSDVIWLSATEQADLLRRREISSTELVRAYLARIEALNPRLGAYVTVCADDALAAARAADQQLALPVPPDAPFLGVPISIKDLVETKGVRTTYSSRAFADYVPDFDAAVVRRLKNAGFVLLGKTNTPEFGNLSFTESILNGVCRNPWNTERTPGGSSGGAAAAVAAGLCPVGHGSDGGGSVRTPASCCGVVGLKPARGRISCAPGLGESMVGLSTDGTLTRTVLDAAAMLDVMAGYETGDPYWAPPPARPFRDEVGASPGTLRVAFTTVSPTGHPMTPECVAAVRSTARLLADLGHHVEEACPDVDPASYDILMRLWVTAPCYYPTDRAELFEPLNQFVLKMARENSSADYVEAVNALHRLSPQDRGLLGRLRRTHHVDVAASASAGRVRVRGHRRPVGAVPARRPVLAVLHPARQRHRPAGHLAAVALEPRRAAHRRARSGLAGRRGAVAASRGPAGGRVAVAGPPPRSG